MNVIDFQNKQMTTTEQEFAEKNDNEEFKMMDGSDDEQVDLLGEDAQL